MKISILGTGAYGIALAKVFEKENEIRMWTKFEEEAIEVSSLRENRKVLEGIKLNKDVAISTDLKECVTSADIIFIAVPISAFRSVSSMLKGFISDSQTVCITSKGIEPVTGLFPSEILEELGFENVAMISGPSFAEELAKGAETGFVVASKNNVVTKKLCKVMENIDSIVVEEVEDILGVQILSATKNIYAILLGMLSKSGTFESTKASVLKCVINDSRKVLEMLGGDRATAYSFAGLGDLLLTCISDKSRNFSFGGKIAEGMSIDQALKSMNTNTVEGLYSLEVMHNLLSKSNTKIKTIDYIYKVIFEGKRIEHILENII